MNVETHYFVIPGLFHLTATDLDFLADDEYPNISRFFKFSKRKQTHNNHIDEVLCEQLGYPTKVLPLAQHFKNDKNVLIATPIRLKADINSTWIQPALESSDIEKIMDDLAKFFEEDLTIINYCHDHYIVDFKHTKVVNHLPNYLTVLGKKIDLYQQSIRENLDWFKLLNEIQMFLHGHTLNKTDSGQQLLNSLWFWGGDSSESLKHKKHIRCDDSLMQLVLSNDVDSSQERLIIKTGLVKYLKLNSSLELDAFFFQLEQELNGLNLNKVFIDTADGHRYCYDQLAKFKFWKNPKNLIESLTQYQYKDML